MEVLCNGRVGDLLAGLSGREVIQLLGRYICSTFSFYRRTLRREAGLVLKNVANLCSRPVHFALFLSATSRKSIFPFH